MPAELPRACRDWLARVDEVMLRDWCIDAADAGWSDEDVLRYWRFGETPESFVAWFTEKYDLIRFEGTAFVLPLLASPEDERG